MNHTSDSIPWRAAGLASFTSFSVVMVEEGHVCDVFCCCCCFGPSVHTLAKRVIDCFRRTVCSKVCDLTLVVCDFVSSV